MRFHDFYYIRRSDRRIIFFLLAVFIIVSWRLTVSIAKLRPFIVTADWRPLALTDAADLRVRLAPPAKQMELFAA